MEISFRKHELCTLHYSFRYCSIQKLVGRYLTSIEMEICNLYIKDQYKRLVCVFHIVRLTYPFSLDHVATSC